MHRKTRFCAFSKNTSRAVEDALSLAFHPVDHPITLTDKDARRLCFAFGIARSSPCAVALSIERERHRFCGVRADLDRRGMIRQHENRVIFAAGFQILKHGLDHLRVDLLDGIHFFLYLTMMAALVRRLDMQIDKVRPVFEHVDCR